MIKKLVIFTLVILLIIGCAMAASNVWLNGSVVLLPKEDKEPMATEGLIYRVDKGDDFATCVGIGEATAEDIVISSTYEGLPVGLIGDSAFENQSLITSVTIPSSVVGIGAEAFYMCDRLETVIFAENSQLCVIDESAFSDCYSLTSIRIPATVEYINDSAFYACNSLKTVVFAENSVLAGIGVNVFTSCENLTSIVIPSGVHDIGDYAFFGCNALEAVYYCGTSSEWDEIGISDTDGANDEFLNVPRYYYSETAPTESGNYWHYVNGEPVVWGA